MAIRSFGPSTLWGVRNDVTGSTPVKFGALQDFTLTAKATTKELMGAGQFADAIGRAKTELTGKASFGWLSARLIADLFFGTSISTGQVTTANAEGAVVPSASTYTVTAANAATYYSDLGVSYAATGIPLQQVASAPAQGQYMVNTATGVYTFAAADAGAPVLLSYMYTVASAGQQLAVTQVQQGIQPIFQVVNERVFMGSAGLEKIVTTLNACVSTDLELPSKQGDFGIGNFSFQAFANAAGSVMSMSFNKVT